MTNRASSPRSSLIPPSATAPRPTLSISKAQAALTLADLSYVTFGGLQGNLYSVFLFCHLTSEVDNSVLVPYFYFISFHNVKVSSMPGRSTHTAGADAIRSN